MPSEAPAGLLLTGGASSRLGRDKASLPLGPGGISLAQHLGAMLEEVTTDALEVGPGCSGLARSAEEDPREGPLAAVAAGARALRELGWHGPVLVLATDLPLLSRSLLLAIAGWPEPPERSVVPVAGGLRQPLCARWSPGALHRAAELAAAGERRLQAALDGGDDVRLLGERDLRGFDLDLELADADDEDAFRRLGFALPEPEA